MSILSLSPGIWADYELIDSGNYEKLERFGKYVLARPEPQAIWDKNLPETEWNKLAHAIFKKEKGSQEKGEWLLKPSMPEQWIIEYTYKEMNLAFRLGLSSFKHVGIFPEQAANWNYIFDKCKEMSKPKVLNLFAYTGGASLAAKAANADVTHVDSIKQVINWAHDNMDASKQSDIRWIVEDAVKFVQREVRRGNVYQGIILDPPSYGRGANGEKWILEDQLNDLMKDCAKLLDPHKSFLVLNLYSMGFSSLVANNIVKTLFPNHSTEYGELYLEDKRKLELPLGVFCRASI